MPIKFQKQNLTSTQQPAAVLLSAAFAPLQKPFLSKRIKHTKEAGEVKVYRLERFDILATCSTKNRASSKISDQKIFDPQELDPGSPTDIRSHISYQI